MIDILQDASNIKIIESLKSIANIIFFVITGIVAVLSYLQARKTLFNPIRTETFKLQLKAFEEVLLYFGNKTESDFERSFDLKQIVSLNALKMADAYASSFFPNEIRLDEEERNKTYSMLVGAVVSFEHMEKHFSKVDVVDKSADLIGKSSKPVTNPAIILSRWQEYEHIVIEYTQKFNDQVKDIQNLAASPLLPKSLRDMIGAFAKKASNNLTLTGKVVGEFSREMPKLFPRAEDMQNFNPSGVWNIFNEQSENFEPDAKKILDSINAYLRVEDLMEGA